MSEKNLLAYVTEFKQTFYPRKWAQYEDAYIGKLRLMPAAHSMDRLRSDYAKMHAMIYGDYPEFDHMMRFIETMEAQINADI